MSPVNTVQSDDDPLAFMLRAPVNETHAERQQRVEAEAEAKRVNDAIDEGLKQDLKKKKARDKREIKVLLLGQSESGKSTCIKQFQLLYSPNSFAAERESWKAVVYLNVVKSIRKVLDAVTEPAAGEDLTSDDDLDDFGAPTPRKQAKQQQQVESIAQRAATPIAFGNRTRNDSVATAMDSPSPEARSSDEQTYDQFKAIKLRLSPLALAEDLLIRQLAGPEGDEETSLGAWASSDPSVSDDHGSKHPFGHGRIKEVFVRSGSNWKGLFSSKDKEGKPSKSGPDGRRQLQHDPFLLVSACRDDMIQLWKDPAVQEKLKKKNIRLQEMPGFYLNDLARVTASTYVPTTQDVLNARLKTLGVVEHLFSLEGGGSSEGGDWRIYDVGGHRDQRNTWAQFFDEVNAIIFLAPISAFDQMLLEDKRVNRIEDSLLLFRNICSNKLLAKVNIVLFLNKIDILKSKLDGGIRLNKYIRSYGDRPNTFEHVSRYFLSKFVAVHNESSPSRGREIYTHMTAVTDVEATKTIIGNVRESILRQHLQKSSLM